MGLYKYQDIGGTWGPKAEGTWTQGRSPREKERHRKNGMLLLTVVVVGGGPGTRTRTRFLLTRGSHPGQPRGAALPARRPAVRALLGAARLEQSAHNEALSDVAAVPEPAGESQGGREGRKEPVGPGAPVTHHPPARDRGATPRGRGSCPGAGAGGPGIRGAQVGSGGCRRRSLDAEVKGG